MINDFVSFWVLFYCLVTISTMFAVLGAVRYSHKKQLEAKTLHINALKAQIKAMKAKSTGVQKKDPNELLKSIVKNVKLPASEESDEWPEELEGLH